MRRPGFTLAAMLAATPAFAQSPPRSDVLPTPGTGTPAGLQPGGIPAGLPVGQAQPAPAPAVDPTLKAHLEAWEKVAQGVTNFHTSAKLVKRNLLAKKESEYTGSIICLKPNLARMRIAPKIDPKELDPKDPAFNPKAKEKAEQYLAYICSGSAVYEYDGGGKTVTEYKLPNGGVGDNLLLAFVSGVLKANDVLVRFDVKLLKEDANYVYLEIKPREARDKADFESMIVVLYGPKVATVSYLPRTVVMRKNNGQEEEVWEFLQPQLNHPAIKPGDFQYVAPPKDWKFQQSQTAAPQPAPKEPRVVRPGAP